MNRGQPCKSTGASTILYMMATKSLRCLRCPVRPSTVLCSMLIGLIICIAITYLIFTTWDRPHFRQQLLQQSQQCIPENLCRMGASIEIGAGTASNPFTRVQAVACKLHDVVYYPGGLRWDDAQNSGQLRLHAGTPLNHAFKLSTQFGPYLIGATLSDSLNASSQSGSGSGPIGCGGQLDLPPHAGAWRGEGRAGGSSSSDDFKQFDLVVVWEETKYSQNLCESILSVLRDQRAFLSEGDPTLNTD